MRLSDDQITAIKQATRDVYGDDAVVWLFGSRVDDTRRGGDIDLLVRPSGRDRGGIRAKLRYLGQLERALGERKIDVVVEAENDQRPIVRVARETGVAL